MMQNRWVSTVGGSRRLCLARLLLRLRLSVPAQRSEQAWTCELCHLGQQLPHVSGSQQHFMHLTRLSQQLLDLPQTGQAAVPIFNALLQHNTW